MIPRVAGPPGGRLIQVASPRAGVDTLGRQILKPGSKGVRGFEERYFMIE